MPRIRSEKTRRARRISIDREYFALTGDIERWLYRVVRKHGAHQGGGWGFTMAQLHHKSGSTRRLADFAEDVRNTAEPLS